VGTALGVGVAYLLTRHLASLILGVQAGFSVSVAVVVASLLIGPLLAVLTTLPGLRRALRTPVAEVLDERVSIDYGTSRLDRALARTRMLSGPARMGVRNALRRKRRTAATIAQITVAIALALGPLRGRQDRGVRNKRGARGVAIPDRGRCRQRRSATQHARPWHRHSHTRRHAGRATHREPGRATGTAIHGLGTGRGARCTTTSSAQADGSPPPIRHSRRRSSCSGPQWPRPCTLTWGSGWS